MNRKGNLQLPTWTIIVILLSVLILILLIGLFRSNLSDILTVKP